MSKRVTLDLNLKENDRTNDPSINLRKKIKIEHDFIISRAKRVNEELDLTDHEVNKFLIIFHTLLDTINLKVELSEPEETDGIVTDIILQIVLKISSLIRQNVDCLPLPQILKDTLKVIKELFNGKKSMQVSRGGGGVLWRRNLRNVPARQAAAAAAAAKQPAPPAAAAAIPAPPPLPPIPARVTAQPRRARRRRARAPRAQRALPAGSRPIGAGGHGEKNIDNAFIRNRGRYKIKQILPAAKNVEVKRRGVILRRMVARRRAIYPALRQQCEY